MSDRRIDYRPQTRADYVHFLEIPTRWLDNDNYGHVNNVVYYAYFDTVVNAYLIREGGLDIHRGNVIGVVVETMCRFHRSFTFPEIIDAGMRVGALGTSSVRYEIGLFHKTRDDAAGVGHFVHVFVDRHTRRPRAIPDGIRASLERLVPGCGG
jgi:acyl-CoA thioester hydrolase